MRQPVPFGKYLLLDRISVGGMAEVFKAKSYGVEGFEKIIAIKRILPTMGEDRDFIKMFIDEAKIAGQLAHANICQIFELGRIDGSHFIAMEYIWGKDLLQIQNRLRKIKQQMPVAMACFCIAKVLEGLDYAHRKRDPMGRPLEIVHRDCSPQNVLVSYEGEVKVIDFGIAKATSRNSRTMAGVLKGKFGYMSPEQVRGLPLDRRSDLFALGTMLYECLTGDRLFQGETDFSTLEKVRNVDIRPPREINDQIPLAVEAVIMKALAKDVEERYQWCSEMLADLQAFLMSQDVVFTAKSLSSWLKDVFSAEIDRERQQLEQYKRVGRDGLIAGVPAAEAKMDVIESLGEAPQPEGDPTMLGGPSFEDVEGAAGAPPPAEVGPAPGSPAARGRAPEGEGEDDGSGDFGEEAPTEIFGEIDHGANPVAALAQARAPSSTHPPASRPPKPPPARPTAQLDAPAPPGFAGAPAPPGPGAPLGAAPASPPSLMPPPGQGQARTLLGAPAPPGLPNYAQQGYPPSHAPYPGQTQPPPVGQPMPITQSQPLPAMGQPMLGQQMPGQQMPGQHMYGQPMPGPPMYGQPMGQPGMYPTPPGGPMPPYGHPMMPGGQMPGGQMPGGPMPGGPMPMSGMQTMPPPGMPGFQNPQFPPGQHPYGAQPYSQPVPPLEQVALPEGKKKTSIARDVGIGVAIAALVLGGFLVVKFLILDSSSDSSPGDEASPVTQFATLRPALPAGETANLFVDDKKIATARDSQEFQVQPGQRRVKLVGARGVCFERELTLAAGKTLSLECAPAANAAPAPSASPESPASGSAGAPGSSPGSAGSGTVTTAPAAGSGSSAAATSAGSGATSSSAHAAAASPPAPAPAVAPSEAPAKPAEHAADKTVHAPARSAKPSASEDDPLGTLSGGVKPGTKSTTKPSSRH